MDLNSYIWLLAPKCRKALVVLFLGIQQFFRNIKSGQH